MKFSDKIRLGCAVRPRKIKGTLVEGPDGACVVGAGLLGGGYEVEYCGPIAFIGSVRGIEKMHPTLLDFSDRILGVVKKGCLWYQMVQMNNNTEMTREEIADWLDSVVCELDYKEDYLVEQKHQQVKEKEEVYV